MSKNTAGYFYEQRKIHRLFGISSIALMASTLWMIHQDHSREWKDYQQAARDMEISRLKAELEARKGQIDPAALKAAQDTLAETSKTLEAKAAPIAAAETAVHACRTTWYESDQIYRAAKAQVDAARYRLEEAHHHGGSTSQPAADLKTWQGKAADLRLQQEKLQEALTKAQARLNTLTADRDRAQADLARLQAQVARIAKRMEGIDHDLPNDWFRDQPLVDYLQPLLKIKEQTPADLKVDYNFMKVQRVDRCASCHVNIDRPGFETDGEGKPLAQPFRSHPRLDLYLDGRASHPIDSFGCTVCHGGQGSSTDFLHAYHTPKNEAQAHEWEERYGWIGFQRENAPLWSFPMLPKDMTTASCRKCHTGRVEVDGAEAYNRGKHVFERAGCWGCHKVAGFEPKTDPKPGMTGPAAAAEVDRLSKVGPDLTHVADKMSPEFLAKWLADPKNFRPHTRMPSFFGVAPGMTPEMQVREADEIQAITAFLFQQSGLSAARNEPPIPAGDAARGKALVETIGCMACHAINGEGPAAHGDVSKRFADFDAFGPDLGGIGSKTSAKWLFRWLKDPKHYFPNGRMPDLRLTDGEAADAAAWLMTLKNEGFEKTPVPQGDPGRMRDILREKLRSKETQAVVDYIMGEGKGEAMPAEIAVLAPDQRPVPVAQDAVPAELGRQMVRRYGCNGCHVIPGFAEDKGIGAELTEVGSKDLAQVDFGFVGAFQSREPFSENALRTRHAWIREKVSDPRIFDLNREKAPLDRLIMPRFLFTDEDAHALTTFLMSMSKERIVLHRQEAMTEDKAAIERGRRIIKDSNCSACHVVGAFPKGVEASALPAFRKPEDKAWLTEHLLWTASHDLERTSSVVEARERATREKASERQALLAPARSFLSLTPEPSAVAALKPWGQVAASEAPRFCELLGGIEKGRQRDFFRPAVPLTVKVAGLGEGVPGRVIADKATGTNADESGKFAPPFLGDLGERVQPDWLYRFLKSPDWEYSRRGGQPIRPKVPLKMPTFGFTDAQAADLVRYFALTAEATYPFAEEASSPAPQDLRATGQLIVKEGLDCRGCHELDGATKEALGPSLDHLAGRLRRDWTRRYIQFPERSQPFVVMPPHFTPKPDGSIEPDNDIDPELNYMGRDPDRQLDSILDYLLTPKSQRAP